MRDYPVSQISSAPNRGLRKSFVEMMHCIDLRSTTPSSIRRALAVLITLLLVSCAYAANETPIRSIDIVQDSDGYVANVVMFAPVPASTAWEVLTDFEHMAGWVPNVRDSKVISRDGNSVTVEQQGVAKFGVASFRYTSVRQMRLDPQRTVHSTQIKGSMRRLESLMTLSPEGDGTKLTYHLEMVPAGLAAAALSTEFLKHELTEQFGAIIEEMSRRARQASSK
jgi:carbon monoxide dehydrogenase subunit G